jgi:hypothetical protein
MHIFVTISYILMGLSIVVMIGGAGGFFLYDIDEYFERGIRIGLLLLACAFVIGGIGWLIIYGII